MTPSKLIIELKNLLSLLLEAEIALHINPVIQQRRAKHVLRVTWGGLDNHSGEVFRGEFATITDYCTWLEKQAYSALLYDGSVLQFSYDFDANGLKGHRLAYHPCPFDVDQELLKIDPVLDVIELYRNQDDSGVRLRSPLRFDYDRANAAEGHPATHLTLVWSHCRWAVIAPLSPGHFIRFVFRHFYPHLWMVHDFIREWPQKSVPRTITNEERGMLHVACI